MLAVVGRPDKSTDMSEPVTAIDVVAELLPPVPVPPLLSLVAPVVPVTVTVPVAVGVPETVHEIVPDGATFVGGVGVQDVVKPAGRPDTAHVAFVAVTDGAAAFVQVKVPEYGVPIDAVAGSPDRLIVMSELWTVNAAVAVLLAVLRSFVAPVVPVTVTVPAAVGVPETVQVMVPAVATLIGGVGEHDDVSPAGRPEMAQLAASA